MNVNKDRITVFDKSLLLYDIAVGLEHYGNIVCLGNFLDKDIEAFFAEISNRGNSGIYYYSPSQTVSVSLFKASNFKIVGVSADTAIKEYKLENKKIDLLCLDLTSDFSTVIESFNNWIDIISPNGKIMLFGCELMNDGRTVNLNSYLFVDVLFELGIIEKGVASLSLFTATIKKNIKVEYKDVCRSVSSLGDKIAAYKKQYLEEFGVYLKSGFSNTYTLNKNIYSHLKMGAIDWQLNKLLFAYIVEQFTKENNYKEDLAVYSKKYAYSIEVMDVINLLKIDGQTINIFEAEDRCLLRNAGNDPKLLYSMIEFEKIKLDIMLPIASDIFDVCRVNIDLLNEIVNSYQFIYDNNIKAVAIFGAGPTGEAYNNFFKCNDIEVKYFIDNYCSNKTFLGVPVIKPLSCLESGTDTELIVLASAGRKKEMKEQLSRLGISKNVYPCLCEGVIS